VLGGGTLLGGGWGGVSTHVNIALYMLALARLDLGVGQQGNLS
jgi:hypothetical protein